MIGIDPGGMETDAVVGVAQHHVRIGVDDPKANARCPGMPDGVGDALLHDAMDVELLLVRGQGDRVPLLPPQCSYALAQLSGCATLFLSLGQPFSRSMPIV